MNIADTRTRWLALVLLCLGDLIIVLDVTIVGVALPSIKEDLGFSDSSLAWVVNAYLLTFGGFLLLGGRLGDLFAGRRHCSAPRGGVASLVPDSRSVDGRSGAARRRLAGPADAAVDGLLGLQDAGGRA